MRIYPDIVSLLEVDRYMEAALVREPSMLVVWGETADSCIARAHEVEIQMMQPFLESMNPHNIEKEKKEPVLQISEASDGSEEGSPVGDDWLEDNLAEPPRRPYLIQSTQVGLTLMLIIICLATGWRNVAIDLLTDGNWLRLAFLIVIGLQVWLALVSISGRICKTRTLTFWICSFSSNLSSVA